MSADNWASCPKCVTDKEERDREQYFGNGKLREDYEIGFYDGIFHVSYRGECQECDFVKKVEIEEDCK